MAAVSVTIKPLSATSSNLLSLHSSLFIPSIPYSRFSTQPIKARLFSTTKKTQPSLSPVVSVAPTSSWELDERVSDWEDAGEDTGFELGSGGYGDSGESGFFEVTEERRVSEEAQLFVGNLPYTVDSENLAMLFEKAGAVELAEVVYNRETNQSRGFGFVTMETMEAAEKAVDMFHQYDLEGKILTVNKARRRQSREGRTPRAAEPGFRLYVGNLPWDVDNARLEQVFSEHGEVVNARVFFDRETGRSRGFGFVTVASQTDMNHAIDALDGQSLDGRAIRVSVAEERPRRGFF